MSILYIKSTLVEAIFKAIARVIIMKHYRYEFFEQQWKYFLDVSAFKKVPVHAEIEHKFCFYKLHEIHQVHE